MFDSLIDALIDSFILYSGLGLSEDEAPQFEDWQKMKQKFTHIFKQKTQKEWCEIFDEKDACVMPILSKEDAKDHPHNKGQKSFLTTPSGDLVPRPAPRLERTPGVDTIQAMPSIGQHTQEILAEEGYSSRDIDKLIGSGVAYQENMSKL